ncbi:MAG: GIY-YIG nuclease family protein [Oscillatoriaceae cyanobacterium Prado104]|jgi:excinuclease UvrABC nuclease subunit|nr:GIY-YIG nuclease family protein [Oscillatoriaceae cyanobacterium Prado104]
MTNSELDAEALRRIQLLMDIPFEECHALTREFAVVTQRSGIYAFRHQQEGILYVGKAVNIRQRLRGGHKALGWAFIDRFDPDDVKIATVRLGYQAWLHALEIEARMIQALRPRYNIRIRQPE